MGEAVKKSWRKVRPEFAFGLLPEILGGDGKQLVLVEKQAALTAIRGLQAKTWGEFTEATGRPFDEVMEGWGEEIAEAYGRWPAAEDPFSLRDYWGAWYFADLITDPRQAALETVVQWRDLKQIFEDAGFTFSFGFPGFPGVEAIELTAPGQARRVAEATGLAIAHDEVLVKSCLP